MESTTKFTVGHDRDKKQRTDDVIVTGEDAEIDFRGLHLSAAIVNGLNSSGFKKPSPIQLDAIPLGRVGYDLLLQAKSGTGKTCVFTVLALEKVEVSEKYVQVVVVNPSREIALQNARVATEIGSYIDGLLVQHFIGGISVTDNIVKSTECHIAVGTPGRLVQLIREEYLDLSKATLLVLDEADKLTDPTFFVDIQTIVVAMNKKKQVIAASATYPADLDDFIVKFMRAPRKIRLDLEKPALLGVHQVMLDVALVMEIGKKRLSKEEVYDAKYKCLQKILKLVPFTQVIIFVQFQLRAAQLHGGLNKEGFALVQLSGKMTQADRTIAFEKMRSGEAKLIVATDLCARGLDSEHLDLVINFDLANDLPTYQHRVGRAGRFGSVGMTINLVATNIDAERLRTYQDELKVELKIIDSIDCLIRLGQGTENLKDFRRLDPSTHKVSGTGIPQALLEHLIVGPVEELAKRQWLSQEKFVHNLIFEMGLPESPHYKIKDDLLSILTSLNEPTIPHCYLKEDLTSLSTVQLLISSILVHLNLDKSGTRASGIQNGLELLSGILGCDDMMTLKKNRQSIATINFVAREWGFTKKLAHVLQETTTLKPCKLTTGTQVPLGTIRRVIIRFFHDILLAGDADTLAIVSKLPFLTTVVDLFWTYPYNSILHVKVKSIIILILESNVVEATRKLVLETRFISGAINFLGNPKKEKCSSYRVHLMEVMRTWERIQSNSVTAVNSAMEVLSHSEPKLFVEWEDAIWVHASHYNDNILLGGVPKPIKDDGRRTKKRNKRRRSNLFEQKSTDEVDGARILGGILKGTTSE